MPRLRPLGIFHLFTYLNFMSNTKENAFIYDEITHKKHPEKGTIYIIAIKEEKQRALNLLFEFIGELETPVINPIMLIERDHMPENIPYFMVHLSPVFGKELVKQMLFYINENL